MKKLLVLAAGLSLTSMFTQAQSIPPVRVNEWKLYGGYQYTALDTHSVHDALKLEHVVNPLFPQLTVGNRQHLDGWDFGIQNDITKWFGVVVDVGGTYKETRLLLTYLLEPKWLFTRLPVDRSSRSTEVLTFSRLLAGLLVGVSSAVAPML
jgi:hypothetical protein